MSRDGFPVPQSAEEAEALRHFLRLNLEYVDAPLSDRANDKARFKALCDAANRLQQFYDLAKPQG